MKRSAALLWAIAMVAAAGAPASAEDSDQLRGYFQLKLQGTSNLAETHDYYGFGVGLNLNRYLGVELSGDHFEIFPKISGRGTIGEYGVFAIMPQVRLRLPLLEGRLVPYVIAGAGIGVTDFNDRKEPAFGVEVKDRSTTPVGTVGAGIEYFLADNISVGLEFKYLFAGDQTLSVAGQSHKINASTPLTSFGLRLFYPELRPAVTSEPREPAPARLYFAGRLGVAIQTSSEAADGVEARPMPYAIGGELNEYFGIAFGLDIRRYLGVELAIEGYEMVLGIPGVGSVDEYAVYAVMPQVRFRWPLLGDRLVPYAIGGVGAAYAETNDKKPRSLDVSTSGHTTSVAFTVGAGLEYFVTSRIAVGAESKYFYSPSHPIKVDGHLRDGTLQGVFASVSLRVYLFDFGR
jgi:opacity protein-like surface antigen